MSRRAAAVVGLGLGLPKLLQGAERAVRWLRGGVRQAPRDASLPRIRIDEMRGKVVRIPRDAQ